MENLELSRHQCSAVLEFKNIVTPPHWTAQHLLKGPRWWQVLWRFIKLLHRVLFVKMILRLKTWPQHVSIYLSGFDCIIHSYLLKGKTTTYFTFAITLSSIDCQTLHTMIYILTVQWDYLNKFTIWPIHVGKATA